jgi:hypothetical protein
MNLIYSIIISSLILISCSIQKHDLPIDLKEVSGIEQISKDLYVSINDSGDGPFLYFLNSAGAIIHKMYVSGANNIDWEDITYDGKYVYVGDIGNNLNQRRDLVIYQIAIDTTIRMAYEGNDSGLRLRDTTEAIKYTYSYPDQENFPPTKDQLNFDSEALTFVEGKIIILSKSRTKPFNGICKIYECEFANENISIKLSQTIRLKGASWLTASATGCDYSNQMLYVLTYKRIYAFEKTEIGYRFVKKKNLGRLQQWEGICVEPNQELRIVAEKSRLGKQKMKTFKLWE